MTQPRSAWPVVVAYGFAASATMILQLTFAPLTTIAAQHYGVSVQAIGWLSQVYSLLYVVFALPTGVALDRWFRPTLSLGAVLTGAGAALRLCGDSFGWMLAGQLVSAVAQPLLLNGITKLAGHYLSERHRPAGIALGMASLYLGEVVAIGIGTAFPGVEQVGTVVIIASGYAIVAALVLLLFLRKPGQFRTAGAAPAGLDSLRAVWGDPFMRSVAMLAFIGFGTFTTYMTWLQALLQPAGVAADAAGGMLLGLVVGGIAGASFLPAWVARRRMEYGLLFASAIVGGVVCLWLALAPGLAVGLGGMPLIGLLQLSTLPVIMEMTERRVGDAAGTATALVWMAGNAGGLAVSMVVQNLIGRPALAFLFLAAITVVCGPLIVRLRRHAGAAA